MRGIVLIGLDAVTSWTLEFRRGGYDASDPGVREVTCQTEPCGPGLVHDCGWPVLTVDERGDVGEVGGEFALDEFACVRVECCCDHATGVHVESYACTLGKHRGLPQMLDRPGTGLRVR